MWVLEVGFVCSMCTNASLYLILGAGLFRKNRRWNGSDALDSE